MVSLSLSRSSPTSGWVDAVTETGNTAVPDKPSSPRGFCGSKMVIFDRDRDYDDNHIGRLGGVRERKAVRRTEYSSWIGYGRHRRSGARLRCCSLAPQLACERSTGKEAPRLDLLEGNLGGRRERTKTSRWQMQMNIWMVGLVFLQ